MNPTDIIRFLITGFLIIYTLVASPMVKAEVSLSEPIIATPESPQAYEPFVIESLAFTVHLPAFLNPSHIEVADSNINLVYEKQLGVQFPAEPAFPFSITVQGLPGGDYAVNTLARYHPGGESEVEYSLNIHIEAGPPTQRAASYIHPQILNYFVTASEDEQTFVIDQGWLYLDDDFNVWPADGPAPETAAPVCRFFIEAAASHFYTANVEECDWLQTLEGLEYEGIAFQALVPQAGACPIGTIPVWRLYNSGHSHPDREANHRFITSRETYLSAMADDWAGEGVAFCSPPEVIEDTE